SAAEIIAGLRGNQNTGMCLCPAHDEKTASLHVAEGHKAVVFKCFGGCSQQEGMDALRARGGWGQQKEGKGLTSSRRAQPGRSGAGVRAVPTRHVHFASISQNEG